MKKIYELKFDKRLYSTEAIKKACYDFLDKATISLREDTSNIIVRFKIKRNDKENTHKLLDDFRNSVLDFEIRILIENEYRLIREMIVAQAFAPCDNITEIIDRLNP